MQQRVLHPSLQTALGAVLDLTVGREMESGDSVLLGIRKNIGGSLTVSFIEVEPDWAGLDQPAARSFEYSADGR